MTHEIISDGKTVWVNDSSGCCIGRFSRNGIDVHHTGKVQMDTGYECIDCKPGRTTIEDWKAFQKGMKEHHGVTVPDRKKPKFLTMIPKV